MSETDDQIAQGENSNESGARAPYIALDESYNYDETVAEDSGQANRSRHGIIRKRQAVLAYYSDIRHCETSRYDVVVFAL